MYKAIRKNKSYDKRKLVIYDDDNNKVVEVTSWCGWFCWSKKFDKNFALVRMEVLKNLYWLLGHDCDEEEWERSIERWDTGKGVMGPVTNQSQFFNDAEKNAARMSFENK